MVWMASYWALIPLMSWLREELMTMSAGRVLGTMWVCDRHPVQGRDHGEALLPQTAVCLLMGTNFKYNFPVRDDMAPVSERMSSVLGCFIR